MKKRDNIVYWIATIWLALGMASSGIVQLMKMDAEVALFAHLGYPAYFLILLGIWKMLGVVALFVPKYPLVKEWAYAGFFFAMSGAAFSHIAVGDSIKDIIPSLLLLTLTILSWYFRPADKKIASV